MLQNVTSELWGEKHTPYSFGVVYDSVGLTSFAYFYFLTYYLGFHQTYIHVFKIILNQAQFDKGECDANVGK